MTYLVCKHKDDGTLFITTRKSRETMLNVLLDLGQEIESVVLKEFEHYSSANTYKKEIEDADNKIQQSLN
jgi:hypothetical protein